LPFESFREIFINNGDLATAQAAYETLTTNPGTYILKKLDLKKFYALNIPHAFLQGTTDTTFNQNFYQSMRKNLGLHRYIQYEGSHEIMYTNPTEIAEKILIAGQD
jgi:hypothetical protein